MKDLLIRLFTFLMLLLFSNCRNDLSPIKYNLWLKNPSNGLAIEKSFSEYSFVLQYKPKTLMALIEAKGEYLSDSTFASLEKSYEGLEYYDLTIMAKNTDKEMLLNDNNQPADYFNKASYFSFEMQKRIVLLVGNDTLPCKLFHFERNYNASPESHFSLGFDVPKNAMGDRVLIYNDEILGLNQVEFKILQKSILKIPQLNYTNKW